MSTPVPELIATTLITRLQAITIAGGYAFDVASVVRVNRDGTGWAPANHTIAVIQASNARDPEGDHEGNPPAIAHLLTFAIVGFVRQSDRATAADQTQENIIDAAMRKAITTPVDWHTFGGRSYNANLGDTERFTSDDGKHTGATLTLEVMYRVSETSPFTVRH
jgi:hypothetical protein